MSSTLPIALTGVPRVQLEKHFDPCDHYAVCCVPLALVNIWSQKGDKVFGFVDK